MVVRKRLDMGADGNVFRIYKFRSMRVHTQQNGVVHQATRLDLPATGLPRGARARK